MQSRGSNARFSGMGMRSPISSFMLAMFATMASFYVAGRLWQDAQNRVYFTKELDRITGQGHSAISVADTLKIIECREQRKKLSALEMELTAARQEGFISKQSSDMSKTPEKGPVIVIGVFTSFGRKNDRDAIRKAWMSTALKEMEEKKGIVARFVIGRSANRGDSLDRSIDSENSQTNDFFILENHVEAPEELSKKTKLFFAHAVDSWTVDYYAKVNDNKFYGRFSSHLSLRFRTMRIFSHICLHPSAALKEMEEKKGIVARFVIGRSANRGDSLDRSIDSENSQTNDFFILENHVEAPEELSKKTKLFFAHAVDSWTVDYYAKVNDNVFVNLDSLGNTLASYLSDPRVYIGCMKSGEVFSEQGHKWYEPDWWKFGDGKTYFRHASTELFVISQALARYISINRSLLRTYAHDDVSVGSWFIGADVKHVDDMKFCCSSWSSGAICSGV